MKQQSKLKSDQQQQHTAEHGMEQQQAAREFATVEEMLRCDAAQTTVPAGIAQRLQKSSADCPKPARPWWQRLFGQ